MRYIMKSSIKQDIYNILGIVIIITGICASIYLGLWILFVGGILDIVNAVRAPILIGSDIGFGVIKMIVAVFVGTICGWLSVLAGAVFLDKAKRVKRFN